jgi:hypothetical protein
VSGGFFLPLVACFQQLMRGEEAYNLSGANVELEEKVLRLINVKAKNHRYVVDSFYIFLFWPFFLPFFFFRFGYPQPLVFPIDGRPHCVGTFLRDYMRLALRDRGWDSFPLLGVQVGQEEEGHRRYSIP